MAKEEFADVSKVSSAPYAMSARQAAGLSALAAHVHKLQTE